MPFALDIELSYHGLKCHPDLVIGTHMPSLHSIESWMMSVITHPIGVFAGAEDPDTQPHLTIKPDRLDQVVCTTPQWPAADRLGVYWNAYYTRLQDCLREEYPVLRGLVGDDLFDEFVLDYLQAYPPSSYTLSRLGSHFPAFLVATRPPHDEPESVPDWADFIAELAAFEWTISEVFDGPGVEAKPQQLPINLLHDSNGNLEDLTFHFAPCLRLCRYQFPVHTYHAAIKAGESTDVPSSQPSFVALTRQDFTVKHYSLTATEFELLKSLQAGSSLGTALAAICSGCDDTAAEVGANIARWFADWTRAGFILQIVVLDS